MQTKATNKITLEQMCSEIAAHLEMDYDVLKNQPVDFLYGLHTEMKIREFMEKNPSVKKLWVVADSLSDSINGIYIADVEGTLYKADLQKAVVDHEALINLQDMATGRLWLLVDRRVR